MEISFVNDEFSENLDEAIAFAKKNNLKYIELRRINGKELTEFGLEELSGFAEKIVKNGLLVSCIYSSFLKWKSGSNNFNLFSQSIDNEEEYFLGLMDVADVFGASNVVIYSYFKDDISLEELAQKLDVYSQIALERGISLLLENDGLCNIDSINKMHELFEAYNFSNIFPLVNMGNVLALGDDFSPNKLQDIVNTCSYFHIKDYDAELKRFVVVGEGNADYEAILAEKTNDYDVILSLEPHTGYAEDLQMSLNMLQSMED